MKNNVGQNKIHTYTSQYVELVWKACTSHSGKYMSTADRMKPVSRVGIRTASTGMPRNIQNRRTTSPIANPEAAVSIYKYISSNTKYLKIKIN